MTTPAIGCVNNTANRPVQVDLFYDLIGAEDGGATAEVQRFQQEFPGQPDQGTTVNYWGAA